MPYAERNNHGEVVSLHQYPRSDGDEYMEPSDREVMAFLQKSARSSVQGIQTQDLLQALANSDTDLARITEDLVSVLIEKNIILFTDLPHAVQNKLVERENLRTILNGSPSEILDEDFQLL